MSNILMALALSIIMIFTIPNRNITIKAYQSYNEKIRLNNVIDLASDTALKSSQIYLSSELSKTDMDAEQVFNDFFMVIADSYGLGEVYGKNTELQAKFNEMFPFMILAVNDGFYIRYMEDFSFDKQIVEDPAANITYAIPERKRTLRLTPKLPYTWANGTDTVKKYTYQGEAITLNTNDMAQVTDATDLTTLANIYKVETIEFNDKRFKEEVLPRINEKITTTMKAYVKKINKSSNQQILLPREYELESSVLNLKGPTLIVFCKDFDIASAPLTTFNIAGTQLVQAKKVYGYRSAINNKLYYCYEDQMDLTAIDNGAVLKVFDTAEEAAQAGYQPDLDALLRN